jgi:HlyD family secretion protein
MNTSLVLVNKGGRAVAVPADAPLPALLEYQSPTAALLARPVGAAVHWMTWVIAVGVAGALAAMVLVPIDREVFAAGKVTATNGNLIVQPMEVSLVRSINVREGQLVHAGDVLAELDPTFAQADMGALQAQVTSLQAEVSRLTAETQNHTYLSDGTAAGQLQELMFAQRHGERSFKLESYAQQIESARAKLGQAVSDVVTYNERLKLAAEVEAKRLELERLQVGSQLDRLQATDTRLNLEGMLASAKSQVKAARSDMDSLVAQRNDYMQQYDSDTSQKLTAQERLLADAREQLTKAQLRRNLVQLRAERDAIVLHVAPVSIGTVMQSGDEFLELVPLDAPLQIEAVVDGGSAGFLRVGNPVTIKFETFPYPLHGTATGTLRSVSPDSFRDPTAAPSKDTRIRQSQSGIGALFFRTRISIDEVRLHDLPEGSRILPGMPVKADIYLGQRNMLGFLMSRYIPSSGSDIRGP